MEVPEEMDIDLKVDQLLKQYDQPMMILPDIESQPHLLISKVRKHYMEYLIKLLSANYETNQRLVNKNVYLPSAIWRCAKNIETAAAQMCMVVQIYRQNIVSMIKEVKNDTQKGKLNRRLYECLHYPPVNEKKLQTSLKLSEDCICECTCNSRKKRRSANSPHSTYQETKKKNTTEIIGNKKPTSDAFTISQLPGVINSTAELPPVKRDYSTLFSTPYPFMDTTNHTVTSSVNMINRPYHTCTSSFNIKNRPNHTVTSSFNIIKPPVRTEAPPESDDLSSFNIKNRPNHTVTSSLNIIKPPVRTEAPPESDDLSSFNIKNRPNHTVTSSLNIIKPPVRTEAPPESDDLSSFNIKNRPNHTVTSSFNIIKPPVRTEAPPESDDLMTQLQKLFQSDPNDDDLFDGAVCDTTSSFTTANTMNKTQQQNVDVPTSDAGNPVIESQVRQTQSLDERLASLAGLLVPNTERNADSNNTPTRPESRRSRRLGHNKWLCEEFYMKSNLYKLLDEISITNRKKLARIKVTMADLFGEESDDDGVVSPYEETPEFVNSCKERIAPWVVKLLTPYYTKGRIIGKSLFKSLAKYLIKLIYQCSHYPNKHEVKSFIINFLDNHRMIRCEADFRDFRIDNI